MRRLNIWSTDAAIEVASSWRVEARTEGWTLPQLSGRGGGGVVEVSPLLAIAKLVAGINKRVLLDSLHVGAAGTTNSRVRRCRSMLRLGCKGTLRVRGSSGGISSA